MYFGGANYILIIIPFFCRLRCISFYINFENFIKFGSMPKAREAGTLNVEGKDYIVKDGDIINVRFNV